MSGLDYIGQTGRSLRERLGSRSAVYRSEMPYRDPHTAGPALWALQQETACDFEISVLPVDCDSRLRKGLEALVVALYRQEHQCSPTVNFGRMPKGYRMSSGNNARLVAAGRRFHGQRCTEPQESWWPGIPPRGRLDTNSHADDWCGHKWSPWVPMTETLDKAPATQQGLYRVRVHGELNVSEILGRKSRLLDEGIGRSVQRREDGAEWRWRLSRDTRVQGLQPRSEHARVHLGQEERRAAPVGCERVAELVRHAAQEPFVGEPAQVVAHLPPGVLARGDTQQLRHDGPQAAIGDALGDAGEEAQGAQEGRHPRLTELQGGCRLPVGALRGLDEIDEVGGGQPTVMRRLFGLQEAGVDVLPERAEVAEVAQPPTDTEVVGVVEGGLGAQGALLLEVLFDVTPLVLDVNARRDAVGDDPRLEAARRGPGDPPREEQLHPAGASEVEIVANDFLKELPAAPRSVEHLGAADLHLQDGEPIGEARGVIARRQGQREPGQPAREERFNVVGAEALAQRRQGPRSCTLQGGRCRGR